VLGVLSVRHVVIERVKMMYIWFKTYEVDKNIVDFLVYLIIFMCIDIFCLIFFYDVYSAMCEKIYVSCRYALG